ncbi:hypothetical protein BCR32DRAFT_292133 [Anaeromyces robustus]|uniref:Scaffoldin n=1 Tax=Anaeromyces robustus TaxID=1754192 RepID=A0A1Y1XCY1_9FUNG|nr:hypothetical protein BCR32DRAFT_292133 [Anaeromyces robustus]|eukprot:ORX83234.1 hypothetical protein BCR32DRAFT_292133 [Anaeromyces robustus]
MFLRYYKNITGYNSDHSVRSDDSDGYYLEDVDDKTNYGKLYKCINTDEFCSEIKDNIPIDDENEVYYSIIGEPSELLIKVSLTNNELIKKINADVAKITISNNSIIISNPNQFEKGYYFYNKYVYSVSDTSSNMESKNDDIMFDGFYLCKQIGNNYCKILEDNILNDITNHDLSSLSILSCLGNECFKTIGYFRYNNNNNLAKCSIDSCEPFNQKTKFNCNEFTTKQVYIDDDNSFNICVDSGNQNYVFINTLASDKNVDYIWHNQDSYKFLYKGTRNIVAQYIGGTYYYDNKKFLYRCDNYCKIIENNNYSGYFLNIFQETKEDKNSLIYCNNGNCEIKNVDNGYYFNNYLYNDYLCYSGKCYENLEILNSKSKFIIKNESSVLYNNDNNISKYIDGSYYYPQYNILSTSDFPYLKEGNDIILLHIKNYSVTQVTTDANGICLDESGLRITDCDQIGIYKYTCTDIHKSCSEEIRRCDLDSPSLYCNGYYLYVTNEKTYEGLLYNCISDEEKSTCVELKQNGFFKVTDSYYQKSIPYIKCSNNNCTRYNENDMNNDCNDNNNFDLIRNNNEIFFCLNEVSIPFININSEQHYICYSETSNIFSSNTEEYLMITRNNNSFVLTDTSEIPLGTYLNNGNLYEIKKDSNGKVIIDISFKTGIFGFKMGEYSIFRDVNQMITNEEFQTDLRNELSNISLYQCIRDIGCFSTNGYLKYRPKNIVVECKLESHCNNEIMNFSECKDKNLNKATYDSTTSQFLLCIKNNEGLNFKTITVNNTNIQFYFTTTNIIFISNQKGNIIGVNKDSNSYYMLTLNDNTSSKLYRLDKNNYSVSNLSGYYFDLYSEIPNRLLYCDNGECEITTKENGYFYSSNNFLIRCYQSICRLSKEINCSKRRYGLIYYSYSIYYCDNNSRSYNSNTYEYVNGIDTSVTYPKIKNGNDGILLKMSDYSLTQVTTDEICISNNNEIDINCENNDYKYSCLSYDKSCTRTYYQITCDPTIEHANGLCYGYYLVNNDLYQCFSNSTKPCINLGHNIKGFFVIEDMKLSKKFIKCNGIKCILKDFSTNNSCKSSDTEETIYYYYSSNKNYFCDINHNEIELSGTGRTLIINNNGLSKDITKKYTGEYVFINITKTSLTLTDISSLNNGDYVTSLMDNSLSIVREVNGNTDIKNSTLSDEVYAFKYGFIENIIFYRKINEDEFSKITKDDLTNIVLMQCNLQNFNICYKRKGFLKYGSNNTVVQCNETSCNNDEVTFNECNSNNIEKAMYDKSDSKFKFCVDNGMESENKKYELKEIFSNKTFNYYYFSKFKYNSSIYNLYLADKNQNIIISYYVYNKFYYYIPKNENKGLLGVCSNGDSYCYERSYSGYFKNSFSDKSNSFIYCLNKSCKIVEKENGYYLNDNNDNYKCYSSSCISITTSSCSLGSIDIVNYNGFVKICTGESSTTFSLTSQYFYLLSSVNIVNSFPNVLQGNDSILLKIDNYSVTQTITGLEGYCYNNNFEIAPKCNTIGLKRILCTDIKKPCVVEDVLCNPKKLSGGCSGYYLYNDVYINAIEGDLYDCHETTEQCELIKNSIGYYLDNSDKNIIQCDGKTCKYINKESISNHLSCMETGSLISYNHEIRFCLTLNTYATLISSDEELTPKYYLISNNINSLLSNKNGGDYVVVKYFKRSIVLVDLKNVNIINNGNGNVVINKIIETGIVTIKKDNNAILDIFSNIVTDETDNIKLYHYYNRENKKITICNYDVQQFTPFYNDTPIHYALVRHKNYNYALSLYIANDEDNKVVIAQDGFYLMPNNNRILHCSSTTNINECYEIYTTGYFINSFENSSNKLIYCPNIYQCYSVTMERNGYFFNNYNDQVIKCISSVCEILNKNEIKNINSCNNFDNTLIYNNGDYIYCYNENKNSITYSEKYLVLTDIDGASLILFNNQYKSGKDTVVLKFDMYSLTQVITDENGICIKDSNNSLDINCNHKGQKYICHNDSSFCTATPVSTNLCNPKEKHKASYCYGYYLVDINENTGEGNLYECSIDGTEPCKNHGSNIYGYFKVEDDNYFDIVQYIKCDGKKCEKLHVPSYNTDHCSNIGELILNSYIVKVCVSYKTMVEFSNYNQLLMLNSFETDSILKVYSTGKKTVITINTNSIVPSDLHKIENNNYIIGDYLYSFKTNANNKYSLDNIYNNGMFAFRMINSIRNTLFHYSMLNDDDFSKDLTEEKSNIFLYNCYNGRCIKTYGYLKYGSSNTLTRCNYACNSNTYNDFNCKSSYKGDVYYDKLSSSLKLCIEKKDGYKFVSIIPNLPINYIMGYNKVYLFNKGANIVGELSQVNYFFIDFQYNNKNQLVVCDNFNCNIGNYTGYFINTEKELTDRFIYCDNPMSNMICKYISKESGYYSNSNNKIIKCINSECQYIENSSSSCYEHNNEIIYYNSLRYCHNNTYDELINSKRHMKYYLLSDISAANSSFPVLRKGEDKILIKINKHSVTQKLTNNNNNNGMCILPNKYNLFENKGICDSGFTKCICTKTSNSCEISKIPGEISKDYLDDDYEDVYDSDISQENEKNSGFNNFIDLLLSVIKKNNKKAYLV